MPRPDSRQPQVRRKGARLVVRAVDVASVAALAATSVGDEPVERLDLTVDHWTRPRGWIGAPRSRGLNAIIVDPDGTGATATLRWREPIDPALALATAVRVLRPTASGSTGPLLSFAAGLPAAAGVIVTSMEDVTSTVQATTHLRRHDTVVEGERESEDHERSSTIIVRESGRWSIDGVDHEVVVDPAVHRPLGRRSEADSTIADASVQDGALHIDGEGLRLRVHGDLTESDVTALLKVRGVRVRGELPHRWGAQLAACGLVVDGAGFPEAGDHLSWQLRSVEASRHALRAHTPAAAMDAWPSVSVVLATHRADHTAHWVARLRALAYPRLQFVIARHGDAFDSAAVEPLRDSGHDLVVIDVDPRLPLGSALQAASDRAEGTLVTKVDDDDWYSAEHVWDLVLARYFSGAQLVGKALDWIHVASEDTTAFRPVYAAEKYATFVAGGTLLISRADLAGIGGWRPVPKSVDRALIERVQAHGALVYRTHGLGYVYVRRGDGHTATVDDRHFLTKAAATWPGLLQHPALGTIE